MPRFLRAVFCVLIFAPVFWGETAKSVAVTPLTEVKFTQDDDVKCLQSALETGDPAAGSSTYILKAPPGCLVSWHWHTAEEQLIVTHGSVLTEMEGMSARTLGPGGFAMMPSKAKHQFSCASKEECIMFVTFDRAYDIYWAKKNEPSRSSGK
jgi:quercetin dioxygenase-like cupin family protein